MKVSGFTIARNVIKFNYPVIESINSILPICDEFVINVGDSDDGTMELLKSIKSEKIRFIENVWDFSQGKEVLSYQTNLALQACTGDWAFYLQTDEVVHEHDLPKLQNAMQKYLDHPEIDALRFQWFHFYGSYFRYRIDRGWYQKQDRIVRNSGQVESYGDAYAFQRKDGEPLRRANTGSYIYHYGWVQPQEVMAQRRGNADEIGFISLSDKDRQAEYDYGDLNRFPIYFGKHPKVMEQKVAQHGFSQLDQRAIQKKYWWFPPQIFKMRYKTGRRVKEKIE